MQDCPHIDETHDSSRLTSAGRLTEDAHARLVLGSHEPDRELLLGRCHIIDSLAQPEAQFSVVGLSRVEKRLLIRLARPKIPRVYLFEVGLDAPTVLVSMYRRRLFLDRLLVEPVLLLFESREAPLRLLNRALELAVALALAHTGLFQHGKLLAHDFSQHRIVLLQLGLEPAALLQRGLVE